MLSSLEEIDADLTFSSDQTLAQLSRHTDSIRTWCSEINFRDLQGTQLLNQVYIDLDTYLMPQRTHMDSVEKDSKVPLREAILGKQKHCIVLGQPGAGKTTSMKKLCALFFDGERPKDLVFPILIRLRELNLNGSVVGELRKLLKFEIGTSVKADSDLKRHLKELGDDTCLSIIDQLKPLIVLDGFDELASHDHKRQIIREIRTMARTFRSAKLVITCRTGEFDYSIDFSNSYEISPLSDAQIEAFVNNWIGKGTEKFIDQVRSSPFADTVMKPLTLGHLCAIYQRTGKIPERPKTVYKKVVGLMLEEWDQQRSIPRVSKYAQFESDRKFEFLSHLSYFLTTTGRSVVFTKAQLNEAYVAICANFGLPKYDVVAAVNEIESHTGLFLQTGFEQFEFAHKSLQEYLTAEYLVKLPTLELVRDEIDSLGAELAIAIAISSNASLYFSDIVLRLLSNVSLTESFCDAFVNRLVQEKPDFYATEDMALASFTLVDVLTNVKPNEEKYNAAMNWLIDPNDARKLLKYYRVESVIGEAVIRLYIKHPIYHLKTRLRIPRGQFSDVIYNLTV